VFRSFVWLYKTLAIYHISCFWFKCYGHKKLSKQTIFNVEGSNPSVNIG